MENAECGVRSMENEEYGKYGVWKMRGVEIEECGNEEFLILLMNVECHDLL